MNDPTKRTQQRCNKNDNQATKILYRPSFLISTGQNIKFETILGRQLSSVCQSYKV